MTSPRPRGSTALRRAGITFTARELRDAYLASVEDEIRVRVTPVQWRQIAQRLAELDARDGWEVDLKDADAEPPATPS